MSRRLPTVLVAVSLLALLSGCVGLPTSGPVKAGPVQQQVADEGQLDYTPGGPSAGASPGEIVSDFLIAMTANPLNTSIARLYLTDASSRSWVPEKATVAFGSKEIMPQRGSVRLRLRDTVQLDGRGEWLGDPSHGRGLSWRLRLVREGGEWRISNPPDALLIPRSNFDARFSQYQLFFFDKTSQVLVPEPVYVPRGPQASTMLVSGLLRGPDRQLLGVERSYLPAGTKLDDLSVPVTRDGTAEVPLTDDVLDLDDKALNLAFAQLAWTLRQIPGVNRLRVTVDGSPLDLPGEGADVNVNSWTEFDPAVSWASPSLFGLRNGHVVAVNDDQEARVSGVLGALDLGLRSVGVDLRGETLAGVTDDGTRVVVAPRNRAPGATPSPSDATTVYTGSDLDKPSYDLYGELWLLDRTSAGARVVVVRGGGYHVLDAPGVSGEDIRRMAVSRDGTRLVSVRDGGRAGDTVQVSRVERGSDGLVRAVGQARTLPLGQPSGTGVKDLAWRTPGTVAVITGTGTSAHLVIVRVDGSAALSDAATDAEFLRGKDVHLVTSPTEGTPLYVETGAGVLSALSSTGRWTGTGIEPGLEAPTFVG